MIRATHQLSLLLFVLSALVYLLLFSGLPISTDEVSLFSGAQSLSQRGPLSATPLYWNENGTVLFGVPGHAYPTFEPTQMIAAAPLHWLGRHLPGVGLVPVVWLFNVLVTAGHRSAALLQSAPGLENSNQPAAGAALCLCHHCFALFP